MKGMSIANIAGGALVERANQKIQEVLNNIMDLNTSAEKKRKVVITLEFAGQEDREIADVTFEVKSTLVPAKKISTRITFESDDDGQVVVEEMQKGAMKGQAYIENDAIVEAKTVSRVVNLK